MNNNKIVPPVKGTRDFYPEDWAFQTWLYEKVRTVSQSFGFQEYEGPILESLELYAAKSGEELVKKQAFTLVDQSGKTLALRPEMTPSLARMVAQRSGGLTLPAKWFTFGRRFRFEKPQKGRAREFFQWDCDILGLENPEPDAEIISVAATLLKSLGLSPKQVKIKINDRVYIQNCLESIGIPAADVPKVIKIIDKKSKVTQKDFNLMLNQIGLKKSQGQKIEEVLNDKNGYQKSEWSTKIFELLKIDENIYSYIEFDPTIVRGLDYYTRTVFEASDNKGQFRAVLGGGRYDNLTAEVGGKNRVPGVGFAMGDMVIAEVLKEYQQFPTLCPTTTQLLVCVFSTEFQRDSLQLTNKIRKLNINAELYLNPNDSLTKQFKYADNKKIKWVVVYGPEEKEKDVITVKNMQTRKQETISIEEFVNIIKVKVLNSNT